MPGQRPSRAVTIATNLSTILLVLGALTSLLVVGSAVVGGLRGGRDIGVHQEVEASRVRSLPEEVIVPETVPVTVRIEDASMRQSVFDLARSIGPIGLILTLLWLVRALLLSVRDGDPFTAANVRRLRMIGFLLVLGVPVIQYVTQLFEGALAASTTVGELGNSYALPGTAPLAGLGVFVLAEVFAHGVRLREDIEGTV
jgi:hypothetical protein